MREKQAGTASITEKQKPSLKIAKISARKTGLNSGITGGGYQCC